MSHMTHTSTLLTSTTKGIWDAIPFKANEGRIDACCKKQQMATVSVIYCCIIDLVTEDNNYLVSPVNPWVT